MNTIQRAAVLARGGSIPPLVIGLAANNAFSASSTCPLLVAGFAGSQAGDIIYEASMVDSSGYPFPTGGGTTWNAVTSTGIGSGAANPGGALKKVRLARSSILTAAISTDVTLSAPATSSGTGRCAVVVRGANPGGAEDATIAVSTITAHGPTEVVSGCTTFTPNTTDILIGLLADDNGSGASWWDPASLTAAGWTVVCSAGSSLGTDTSVIVAWRVQAFVGAQVSATLTRAAGSTGTPGAAIYRIAVKPS